MPSLAEHQSNDYTKLLLMGDSGSGKTGALASLVGAGYSLRILDFDNGLDSLKAYVAKDHPERLSDVEYRTLRDQRKATPEGFEVAGAPKAFGLALKMLDRWKYTDDNDQNIDLGVPSEWGPKTILVIDSLTFFSDAAFDYWWVLGKNNPDKRAVYKNAQDSVESVLAGLSSDTFRTNVIVISHVKYMENTDGTRKGFPTSVGSALSPVIPRYFNTVAMCRTKAGKRTIQTAATNDVDLKNPRPFDALPTYDISDGLARFFEALRAGPNPEPFGQKQIPVSLPEATKPTAVTLRRRA